MLLKVSTMSPLSAPLKGNSLNCHGLPCRTQKRPSTHAQAQLDKDTTCDPNVLARLCFD